MEGHGRVAGVFENDKCDLENRTGLYREKV